MNEEKIWVMERNDSGYRFRQTTRSQEAVRNWAAIAVVIIGFILIYVLVI